MGETSHFKVKRVTLKEIKSALSTIHITGCDRLLNGKKPTFIRFIWASLMIVGFAFLIYHVHDRIENYLRKPIQVDIQFEEPDKMLFPSITICLNSMLDLNPDKTTKLESLYRRLYDAIKYEYRPQNFTQKEVENINWRQFLESARPDLRELVICLWVDGPGIQSPCFSGTNPKFQYSLNVNQDFRPIVQGHCYTIESNLSATASDNLLMLILHSKTTLDQRRAMFKKYPNRTTPLFKDNLYPPIATYIPEYYIVVHSQDELPVVRENSLYIVGDSNTKFVTNVIQITRRDIISVESRCIRRKNLQYFKQYSKSRCNLECFRNYSVFHSIAECRCFVPFGTHHDVDFSYKKACHPNIIHVCFEKMWKDYKEQDFGHVKCGCENQCQRSIYDTSLIQQALPPRLRISKLKDYTIVQIKYKTMQYTIMQQKYAYNATSLLAEIGGAMGFLLGIRLLTLMEVGEVFVGLMVSKFMSDISSIQQQRSIRKSRRMQQCCSADVVKGETKDSLDAVVLANSFVTNSSESEAGEEANLDESGLLSSSFDSEMFLPSNTNVKTILSPSISKEVEKNSLNDSKVLVDIKNENKEKISKNGIRPTYLNLKRNCSSSDMILKLHSSPTKTIEMNHDNEDGPKVRMVFPDGDLLSRSESSLSISTQTDESGMCIVSMDRSPYKGMTQNCF